MYRFQHIEYLWALVLIPVLVGLYFLLLNWKKKTARKIGDERLVKEITKHHSPARFNLKFLLLLVAFALGAVALANIRLPEGSRQVSRNGIDVMIALDVSRSMLARDVKPDRLERAKLLLNKLVDKLSNDRIGIVIFAGKAYLQMPLTGDHGAAKMYLSAATPDAVPTQGTVVSEALKMCYSAFNAKEKKYKAVVLISDGEDHDEGALTIAGKMADEGIVINTVGIGSPDGSTLFDEVTGEVKKDNEGNVVISKLNEKELMGIAEKGNGIYQLYSNTDEVANNLTAQLGSMDQRTVTEDSLVNYRNLFPYFLMVVLLLLVVEILVSERRRIARKVAAVAPKEIFSAGLLFFFLMLSFTSQAQENKEEIKKGNDAYEKKEYGNAITAYKKVTDKAPSSTTAQYNLGNALYRDSKTDESVAAYDAAVKNAARPADKAKAYYNKGVVLQNNKKLPECIEAYKNALKLTPQDEDARQNLQKALVQQQQQQQKKEKKEDKKDQQKKGQQKKDQPKDQQQNQQPKPQPSKLSKQDAEEKLKALLQQEKNLHDKMQKINAGSVARPEKDW